MGGNSSWVGESDSGAPRACPGPAGRVGSHRCAGGSGQSTQTGARYQVGPPFTRGRKSGSLWLKQKETWPAHIPRKLRSGSGFGRGVQAQAILSDSFLTCSCLRLSPPADWGGRCKFKSSGEGSGLCPQLTPATGPHVSYTEWVRGSCHGLGGEAGIPCPIRGGAWTPGLKRVTPEETWARLPEHRDVEEGDR